MQKNESISKGIFWQTSSRFLTQGLVFFTAPIFTRIMSPSDYGQLSTYSSWVSFISIFVGLQTDGSIGIARIKYSREDFDKFLSSIMSISFLSFIVFFSFTLIFRNQLGNILGFPSFIVPAIVVNSFFSYCVSFYSVRLIHMKQVKKNAYISYVQAIVGTVLSIFFITRWQGEKYLARIAVDNIMVMVQGVIFIIIIYSKGKIFYNKSYWDFCFAYTLPLILHGASGIVFTQSDRVMLKSMIGETETGIYSVVYTLALVINILWYSFNSIWAPYYYEYKKNEDNENIKKKSTNYMVVFTILTIGFMFLAPEVFKILAPENYWKGLYIIPLVAVAYYFNFIYAFPANYEFYNAKTKVIALGTTIAALINIALNYLLIPMFAGIGAAIATIISHISIFVIHEINVRLVLKAKDFDYNILFYLKGIIPVSVATIMYYIFLDIWIVRWGGGLMLGCFLMYRIVKNKGIL